MWWDTSWAASIQKHTYLYMKHPWVDMGFVTQQLHKLRHTIHLLASPFTLVALLHINFKQCIQ